MISVMIWSPKGGLCRYRHKPPWGAAVLFKNYFKKPISQYFYKLIIYLSMTVVVYMLTNMCCRLVTGDTFFWLIVRGVICLFIPNILFWIVYHRMREYGYMKIVLQRVFKN